MCKRFKWLGSASASLQSASFEFIDFIWVFLLKFWVLWIPPDFPIVSWSYAWICHLTLPAHGGLPTVICAEHAIPSMLARWPYAGCDAQTVTSCLTRKKVFTAKPGSQVAVYLLLSSCGVVLPEGDFVAKVPQSKRRINDQSNNNNSNNQQPGPLAWEPKSLWHVPHRQRFNSLLGRNCASLWFFTFEHGLV